MTESYKYDTAGWHLLHTDNDGNFITGDDAVTITTGANGDISEGGLWKLTANGANEFARIPNNVALTSDNWEAGDRDNILPNTVYWVYTGVIAQAEVTSFSVEIATRYVADVSNSYWFSGYQFNPDYTDGVTEVYIKNTDKIIGGCEWKLNNGPLPQTSGVGYNYDNNAKEYIWELGNIYKDLARGYTDSRGSKKYPSLPLWNKSGVSFQNSDEIDPVQNLLIMLSTGASTDDGGTLKSTGIPMNTVDENDFRLLFHVPGNPRITMNSIGEYIEGQSTQPALVENVDYQVLRADPLTSVESTTVKPTLTFSS